jgi:hypothetical protein
VQNNDTLNSIAAKFGLTPSELAKANRLSSRYVVFPGQSLKVPKHAAAAAPSASPPNNAAPSTTVTPPTCVVAAADDDNVNVVAPSGGDGTLAEDGVVGALSKARDASPSEKGMHEVLAVKNLCLQTIRT